MLRKIYEQYLPSSLFKTGVSGVSNFFPSNTAACKDFANHETPETPETPSKQLHDAEYWQALYEERAAIMEFDGGLPRKEAERLANEWVRITSNTLFD